MPQPTENKKIINLPNGLTFFRLACIPLVAVFLSSPGHLINFLAALFFSLGFITDFLDGYFARKYDEVTVFGKFLDPLADKILVTVTMIMLIPLDRILTWIVILIITREMAITGLRSIAVSQGIVIQAGVLGKYKTIFQATALICLCLHHQYLGLNFHTLGIPLLWLALFMTLWSGVRYFLQFNKGFTKKG